MRDFDLSYNWSEGLDRYPHIETERKFVQKTLRGNNDTISSSYTSHTVNVDILSFEQRLARHFVIRSLHNSIPIRLIVCEARVRENQLL